MKKLLLSLVTVFALTTVNAQENESYKPASGDVTAEFGLTGGLASTGVSFSGTTNVVAGTTDYMLRGRYFNDASSAYRVSAYVHSINSSVKVTDSKSASTSNTALKLGFGLEKHFKGTKRLSPYIGGDFLVGVGLQSTNNEAADTKTSGPTSFGVGVRGVLGADYYFVQNVYLGVEAGLGVMYNSLGKATATSGSTQVTTSEGGSSFNVDPAIVGVRLGFVF